MDKARSSADEGKTYSVAYYMGHAHSIVLSGILEELRAIKVTLAQRDP